MKYKTHSKINEQMEDVPALKNIEGESSRQKQKLFR
jgi:hypothetical protein